MMSDKVFATERSAALAACANVAYQTALEDCQKAFSKQSVELTALRARNEELRGALERAGTLVRLLTIRDVIDCGSTAIEAAGINPWCLNEGLAQGDENISTWWIDAALSREYRAERCEHCGAGDEYHHSISCPTGLHPSAPALSRDGGE